MAIPGSNLSEVEVRAKVKVGLKNERGYPQSVDHFVSDDPEIVGLGKTSELRIVFPYPTAEECFRTGLEWWKGKLQVCFTHDETDPTAYRVAKLEIREDGRTKTLNYVDAHDELRGELVGKGRQPIKCRANACPHFGKNAANKECRPSGRLTFFMAGGRTDGALQFQSKGWNTIKSLAGTLAACQRSGPLDAPGRIFLLTVAMERDGDNRFPVVKIKEENVEVSNESELKIAESLVRLRAAVDAQDAEMVSQLFKASLDLTNPGWRERQDFIDRVLEVGVPAAALGLLTKYNL